MIKNIFSSIIIFLLIGLSFYFSGFYGVITFLASLFVYYSLAYLVYFSWKTFTRKTLKDYKEFALWFLYKISLFVVIIGTILGSLAYYSNEISPAPMPGYLLKSNDKEVLFQAMSHIGTKEFYKTIQNDLKKYKEDGGVYFYEGVKPGTKENMEGFNNAIGIKFNKELYGNFGKLYGVQYQNNSIYLNLVNNLDFNVDIGIDDIMNLYNKKPKKDKSITPPLDVTQSITETLTSLNERELKVLVYINQAILNFIIKSEKTQNLITNNFGNKELFDVILNNRNEFVADAILKSQYKKIYVTYGLLHFKGIFELLKEKDSSWEIVEVNNLYPIN